MRDQRPHPGAARLILAAGVCLLLAGPAISQERSKAQKATLSELAFALGQSHALRQACRPEDQTWRSRMGRMLEVEAPDPAFAAVLSARFNAGFADGRARAPACTEAVVHLEAEAAARGRRLAQALAETP